MGNNSSQETINQSLRYSPSKYLKDLESLEEIIFNLNEDNIIDSIETSIKLLNDNDITFCSNLIFIRLIYFSIISHIKDFNLYLNLCLDFMNQIEIKEKEINKSNYELINAFIDFLLTIDSQESYFILERLIEMNLIPSKSVENKNTFYFVHHFPNILQNHMSDKRYDEISEELSQNDFKLHKQLIEEGENPNEIAKIIRNDEMEKLQEISSQTNFDFDQIIKPSLYERCSFINKENVSLIDYAAFFSAEKCFKHLLLNGAKVENTGIYAIAGGNEEIIHLCEQNHSSFKDAYKIAIEFHRNDIFKYLYENKIVDHSAVKLFEIFLSNNFINYEIISFLLEQKEIDINAKDRNGKTVLIKASSEGNIEIVKLLLEQKGIDINAKDNNINTALMIASDKGHTEIVKLLLEQKGIDVNTRFCLHGWTLLMRASINGYTEIVKLLLEQNRIDINAKDYYRRTALMNASERGHTK